MPRRRPKAELQGLVQLEPGSPPSSYAVAGLVTGEDGAVLKTVGLTALRSVFIAPGLWIGGKVFGIEQLKIGWRLLGMSVLASCGITAGMILWYTVGKGVFTSFAQQQPLPTTNTIPK